MLRVGLTGGLGSGKSTAARMFAAHGAHVFSSDEIGRELMQPGQPVYAAIVAHFGNSVLAPDGSLDRAGLARIAFGGDEVGGGRVEELNAIVHPAVIDRQAALIEEIAASNPTAIVMIESALIFETKYGETKHGGTDGWHKRFDKIILVTAPEDLKIARFVARTADASTLIEAARTKLETEARRRIAQQTSDASKIAHADYTLSNNGSLADLAMQVDAVWSKLASAA
jgi:dephospho-CoA kinase